jgi:hypothetical protein
VELLPVLGGEGRFAKNERRGLDLAGCFREVAGLHQ